MPNELLDILNNVNLTIQFTIEKSDTQLVFFDIMINKEGKNSFMDIYLKPMNPKRHVSIKSNDSRYCLKNISFSLTPRTVMVAEKHSLKEFQLKELEKLLLDQYYPERIIKTGINKILKIPQS